MDVTVQFDVTGATVTVEVSCEARVHEVVAAACTALGIPGSAVELCVEGTALERTTRLQDSSYAGGLLLLRRLRNTNIRVASHDYSDSLCGLALSPCGQHCALLTRDGSLRIFNTGDWCELTHTQLAPLPKDVPLAFSRCGLSLFTGSKDIVHIDVPTGNIVTRTALVLPPLEWLCTTESYVVHLEGGAMQVRDVADVQHCVREVRTDLEGTSFRCVAVSAANDHAVTSDAAATTVCVWDLHTGAEVWKLSVEAFRVAMSPCAQYIAVESHGTEEVRVHRVGRDEAVLGDVGGGLHACSFTPCGGYLLLEKDDDTAVRNVLRQVRLDTGECVALIGDFFARFTVTPCSRIVLYECNVSNKIVAEALHPYIECVSDDGLVVA